MNVCTVTLKPAFRTKTANFSISYFCIFHNRFLSEVAPLLHLQIMIYFVRQSTFLMWRENTMIKCIIFDMDGVLINTEPIHYKIWKQVFSERGLIIDYEIYKNCLGSTYRFLMELIYNGYGRDFREDPTIIERFCEIKDQVIRTEGIPALPGVQETVRTLRQKGYKLAVASSSPQTYIDISIQNLGISSCFDLLFSTESVKNPKPAPDVFLAVAENLQMKPEECLVVEDSCNGTRAAKAAGMYCAGFANPDSGNQDISAADKIFYPFSQLIETVGL